MNESGGWGDVGACIDALNRVRLICDEAFEFMIDTFSSSKHSLEREYN